MLIDVRLVHYCSKLHSVSSNYSLSTADVVFGTVVVAVCFTGYSFPDKNLTKSLECVDGDSVGVQWNETLEDCYGN